MQEYPGWVERCMRTAQRKKPSERAWGVEESLLMEAAEQHLEENR